LTGLTAIEKRLLALEGIGKEKGMQTDQMEGCMIKLKRLEKQLSKNQTIVSNGGLMPDQSITSGVPEGVNFSQRYIDELVVVISKIESKVQYLEQLYRDVLLLQGQAETLRENIHLVEQNILMKSNEQSKLEMSKSENSLCISEKLEGKMENIAILEKEISDLLKESDMNNIGKKLDSIDEWEVVDKQSLQEEMSASSQQCLSSADVAKKQIGKGLQRTYSQETTELIAKVDGIKESVDEQKALRMLERENSLEFLDYGGTGGPVEQEAALLLERVDQGLTQIITDQSETHLMSSLQKEFTPDRLESDTSLADHEREKMHQQQLIRQIQEMQDTAVLHEGMEADELIASLDKDHQNEKEKQMRLLDQSQAMINIELMRKSVMKRQEDIHNQMEEIMSALSLRQTEIKNESIDDNKRVEYQQSMDHQCEMMQQISQDTKLIDVELGNIAAHEQRVLGECQQAQNLDSQLRLSSVLRPIAALRKTIAELKQTEEAQSLMKQLDFMSSCLDAVQVQIFKLESAKWGQAEQSH